MACARHVSAAPFAWRAHVYDLQITIGFMDLVNGLLLNFREMEARIVPSLHSACEIASEFGVAGSQK